MLETVDKNKLHCKATPESEDTNESVEGLSCTDSMDLYGVDMHVLLMNLCCIVSLKGILNIVTPQLSSNFKIMLNFVSFAMY